MKIGTQINNIHYLMKRLGEIQNRAESERRVNDADLVRVIQDATYALGMIAATMSEMETEHEKMKMVLRWFVKGDLEEHLDEVRTFIENP